MAALKKKREKENALWAVGSDPSLSFELVR